MSVKYLYLVAVAAIIGCGPGSSASPPTPAARRMSNLLSANEIVAAQADLGTAYDALARLRPNWLAAHGTSSFSTPGTEFAIKKHRPNFGKDRNREHLASGDGSIGSSALFIESLTCNCRPARCSRCGRRWRST